MARHSNWAKRVDRSCAGWGAVGGSRRNSRSGQRGTGRGADERAGWGTGAVVFDANSAVAPVGPAPTAATAVLGSATATAVLGSATATALGAAATRTLALSI